MIAQRRGRSALQEIQRVDADAVCDALEAAESQVALAALHAAHVRAMHAEDVREGLLAETERLAVPAQVAPDSPLQISFHRRDGGDALLDGLQTYR